jgi:hypothetical protein
MLPTWESMEASALLTNAYGERIRRLWSVGVLVVSMLGCSTGAMDIPRDQYGFGLLC